LFAAGSETGGVVIWQVRTGRVLGRFSLGEKPVGQIGFGPGNRYLVASRQSGVAGEVFGFGDDPIVRSRRRVANDALFIWDLQRQTLVRQIGGEHGPESVFAFSNDGALLATTGGGCTLRLWHVPSWTPIDDFSCLRSPENVPLTALSFATAPKPVLRAMTGNGELREWDLGAIARLRGQRLLAAVCANNLVGGESLDLNDPSRLTGIRRITATDVDAAPILRGREGEDVCDPPNFLTSILRRAHGVP
jgi:hypothetical protein